MPLRSVSSSTSPFSSSCFVFKIVEQTVCIRFSVSSVRVFKVCVCVCDIGEKRVCVCVCVCVDFPSFYLKKRKRKPNRPRGRVGRTEKNHFSFS
jgi:hypothetical protein